MRTIELLKNTNHISLQTDLLEFYNFSVTYDQHYCSSAYNVTDRYKTRTRYFFFLFRQWPVKKSY